MYLLVGRLNQRTHSRPESHPPHVQLEDRKRTRHPHVKDKKQRAEAGDTDDRSDGKGGGTIQKIKSQILLMYVYSSRHDLMQCSGYQHDFPFTYGREIDYHVRLSSREDYPIIQNIYIFILAI